MYKRPRERGGRGEREREEEGEGEGEERERERERGKIKSNLKRKSDSVTRELTYFAHAHSILANTNIKGVDRKLRTVYTVPIQ